MKLMLTTALLTGLLTPCAFADDDAARHGSYVALEAGTIGDSDYDYGSGGLTVDAELDSGSQFGAAWGVVNNNWRFEVGLRHQEQDLTSTLNGIPLSNDGSAEATILEVNAYYDFPLSDAFRPYIGAGIGAANLEIDDGAIDDNGEAVSLQAMVGASYQINDRFAVYAQARAQFLRADVEMSGDEDELEINTTSVLAGVRIRLGS